MDFMDFFEIVCGAAALLWLVAGAPGMQRRSRCCGGR